MSKGRFLSTRIHLFIILGLLACLNSCDILEGVVSSLRHISYIKRYHPNHVIYIPLTKACIVKDVRLPEQKDGWLFNAELVEKKNSYVLLLEWLPSLMPDEFSLRDAHGSIQLAIRFGHPAAGRNIALDKISEEDVCVINSFADYPDKTFVFGGFSIDSMQEKKLVISGKISLKSYHRETLQEICFNQTPIRLVSLLELLGGDL